MATANLKGKPLGEKRKEPATAIIPVIKKGALSVDVGPMVIAGLARVRQDEEKANEVLRSVDSKRYDLLATLTAGIVKAAKADQSIDLASAFKEGADGAKAATLLNDQLGIALGFRHVVTVGDKQRVDYTAKVAEYFPNKTLGTESEEYKKRSTFRSNFLHTLKKCVMAACGLVERKIDMKYDKKAGTLAISGPEVKAQFGQATVLLNEKQKVTDGKGKETTLKEKPSFTAIAAKAAVAHGKQIHRGSNTRGAAGQALANPALALKALCAGMVKACAGIKGVPSADIKTALESAREAIDKVLD